VCANLVDPDPPTSGQLSIFLFTFYISLL